ncbi:MAG: hypothetical protein CM1200mP9_08050 [Gammaproteobacteria bacterium]|nr:MAG: hypothetical protein CM1200mP9_08050 [Gammaproteobacteria bacterium]
MLEKTGFWHDGKKRSEVPRPSRPFETLERLIDCSGRGSLSGVQSHCRSPPIAFEDLGMEAIYEFEVNDMPVTVAVDPKGESIHKAGPAEWRQNLGPVVLKPSRLGLKFLERLEVIQRSGFANALVFFTPCRGRSRVPRFRQFFRQCPWNVGNGYDPGPGDMSGDALARIFVRIRAAVAWLRRVLLHHDEQDHASISVPLLADHSASLTFQRFNLTIYLGGSDSDAPWVKNSVASTMNNESSGLSIFRRNHRAPIRLGIVRNKRF